MVADVESAFDAYERAFGAVVDAEPEGARTAYAASLVPAFERTRAGLGELRALNRRAAVSAGEEAGSMARTALWAVGLGTLLAVGLGAWGAAKLSRQIASAYDRPAGR